MDIKVNEAAEWRRIKPSQATAMTKKRNTNKTADLGDDELRGMLGGEEDSE